eukprot:83538-Pyramimonas_sp.AAC.1
MRAQAATCSGLWAPGACTATLLGFLGAAKDDPQLCAEVWIRICTKMGQIKYRWQVVRGPMAATIAALRDLGWQAESPGFWRAEDS